MDKSELYIKDAIIPIVYLSTAMLIIANDKFEWIEIPNNIGYLLSMSFVGIALYASHKSN
jgi:hypothetical protein